MFQMRSSSFTSSLDERSSNYILIPKSNVARIDRVQPATTIDFDFMLDQQFSVRRTATNRTNAYRSTPTTAVRRAETAVDRKSEVGERDSGVETRIVGLLRSTSIRTDHLLLRDV